MVPDLLVTVWWSFYLLFLLLRDWLCEGIWNFTRLLSVRLWILVGHGQGRGLIEAKHAISVVLEHLHAFDAVSFVFILLLGRHFGPLASNSRSKLAGIFIVLTGLFR